MLNLVPATDADLLDVVEVVTETTVVSASDLKKAVLLLALVAQRGVSPEQVLYEFLRKYPHIADGVRRDLAAYTRTWKHGK